MVIRNRERAERFVRAARTFRQATAGMPHSVCRAALPLVGPSDVWAVDGLAICRPVGSRLVLVIRWELFSAHCRRHELGFYSR